MEAALLYSTFARAIDEAIPRHERKFIVPLESIIEVEKLCRFNHLKISRIYPERRINNIYFDTPYFRFYRNSIEGLSDRLKIRIRWYGDILQNNIFPVLEIKTKKNNLGFKINYTLGNLRLNNITTPDDIATWLQNQQLPDEILHILDSLKPVLINSYLRNYWMTENSEYRLTLDKDIAYSSFGCITDRMILNMHHDYYAILEIKNHPDEDITIEELTGSFLPRLARYSKYTNGVDVLYNYLSLS